MMRTFLKSQKTLLAISLPIVITHCIALSALAEDITTPQPPASSSTASQTAKPATDLAEQNLETRPISRLNRLMLNQDTMYLPTRLTLGESNKFLIKGKPGSEVMLYISPKGDGYKLPNGTALKVGETYESIAGKIPENGVLSIEVPVPGDEEWAGHYLFVDAVTWTQKDYTDLRAVQLLDATGRRTADNSLVMMPAAKAGGNALIMPSMPGMPAGALQQLTQTSQILGSHDQRKKDLLYDGTRNADTMLDRNSLLNRPGFGSSPLQQGP